MNTSKKSNLSAKNSFANFYKFLVVAFFIGIIPYSFAQCTAGSETYGINVWNSYAYNSADLSAFRGAITSGITTNNSTQITANWGAGAPGINAACGTIGANTFTTSHRMNRVFNRGWYVFTYSSDDGIRISVDGGATWAVVNSFGTSTVAGVSDAIYLDGSTNVRVDQREASGNANLNVSICEMNGTNSFGSGFWNAYVFDNMDVASIYYQGTFTESNMNFCNSWGSGQPTMTGQRCGKSMDNDYFSVRYVRQNAFPAGDYVVRTITDDGLRVGINSTTGINYNIINSWNTSTNDVTSGVFSLNGSMQYVYFEMRENTGGATASFNILKIPANPTGISSNLANNAICTSGGSITLTASGTEGTVYWYSGSCGGTFVGTGNSITVNPSSNTTYYARNRNYSDAGCGNTLERFSPGCASINVTVGTPPTGVDAGVGASICSGNSVVLAGTTSSTAASGSWSGSGGTSVNGTYGSGTNITVNVPALPAGAVVTSTSVVISFTANSPSYRSELRVEATPPAAVGGIQNDLQPSTDASAGAVTSAVLGTWSTGNPTGNWLFRFRETFDDAGTDANISNITITVNYNVPSSVSWSGGPIASGSTTLTPTVNPASTTTYTMTATFNGCSASDVVTVNVDVAALAGNTTVSAVGYTPYNAGKDIDVCPGTQVAITRTGGSGTPHYWGGDYTVDLDDWDYFDNQTFGNSFTYTFPNPGNYLIRCHSENVGCGWNWGSYSDVIVHVSPVDAPDISADQVVCSNENPAQIIGSAGSLGAGSYSYLWKQSTDNGVTWSNASSTNTIQNYTPPLLSTTTLFKREVTSNSCVSKEGELVSWAWTSGAPNYNGGALPIPANDGTVVTAGSSIRKIYASWGATDSWNAGAISSQRINNNGGYVEFEVEDNNKYRMCGLGNSDTDPSYTSIEFAIYPTAGGTVEIYESGVYKGTFGTYVRGDVFRCGIENSIIRYYKNGVLFYTSLNTPTLPLYADVSIYTPGGGIKYVRIQDPVKITVNPAPVVATPIIPQNFCGTGTVASLTATGSSIKWYTAASGGSALTPGTALTTATYYVTQTVGSCESARIPVPVNLLKPAIVPTVSAGTPNICGSGTTTLSATNMAPGGNVGQFNGTQNAGGLLTSVNNTFSVDFWVNPAATRVSTNENNFEINGTTAGAQQYAIHSINGGSDAGMGVSVGTNGVSVFEHGSGYMPSLLVYDAAISGWNHITVVYNNRVPSLYINGVFVKTGVVSARTTVYPSYGTGGYSSFTGSMDNVRIWNGALTQAEIQAVKDLENVTSQGGKSALAHYKFNGGIYTSSVAGPPAWISPAANPAATYYTYTWSGGPALPAASNNELQTTGTISTNGTHNYSVAASVAGCTGAASSNVPVVVNPNLPASVSIAATPGTNVCIGTNVTFTATPTNGGTPSYQWKLDGLNVGTNSSTYSNNALTNTSVVTCVMTSTATCATGSPATSNLISGIVPAAPTSIAGTASAVCQVPAGSGWVRFLDGSGKLVVSINPGSNNLGLVTADAYDHGSSVLTQACNTGTNPEWTTAVLGRSWKITPTNNLGASLELPFEDGEMSNLVTASSNTASNPRDNVISRGDLKMSRYSGASQNGSWSDNCADGGTSLIGGQLGNGTSPAGIATSQYVQFATPGFSEFWLHGNTTASPLPITLTNFGASCDEKGDVALNWSTASEQNASHFVIERSRDLVTWNVVSTLPAGGNTTTEQLYALTDADALGGVSYYRLVQVDFDGESEVYGPIAVTCESSLNSVKVYPNPTASAFTVEINSLADAKSTTVQLTDVMGKVISSKSIDLTVGTNHVYFQETFESGAYLIRVLTVANEFETVKVVVKH